jgi:hypothetical protein
MKSDRCRRGKQRIMTTKRALFYRTGTAFVRRKDVWIWKRLAAEAKHFELDGQVLRKGNRLRIEIGVSAVDAQKYTLERVTRCAA